MQEGLLADFFGWVSHPIYSDGNVGDWLAGIVLLLIAAFLWSTVVRRIAE